MKQYPIIMQPESIAGIRKQCEWEKLIPECTASDSLGNLYDGGRIIATTNGCKTETRRLTGLDVVNENPDEWIFDNVVSHYEAENNINNPLFRFKSTNGKGDIIVKSPYGIKGDELWVKEAYAYTQFQFDKGIMGEVEVGIPESVIYKADECNSDWDGEWKNTLYMPKTVSRITLINEGITIERLQDITEEGAIREGVYRNSEGVCWTVGDGNNYHSSTTPLKTYERAWKHINGEASWDANPFVWVLKFSVKNFK